MSERTPAPEKVSVIMPTYNSVRTVDRAIDSVLAQTYAAWQLIIIDDASTDATVQKVIERCRGHEDRMMLVCCQENGGPAAARNRGLAACDGEWIAVLDSDDAWRIDRLESLLGHAHDTSADAVCDNLLGFDDHLGKVTGPLFSKLPIWLDVIAATAPTYAGSYDLGYLKPTVRRAFIERHHIRYDESLRTGEDLVYLLSLLIDGARIACVDDPLYIYTTPVGDVSRRLSQSTKSVPRDMDIAKSLARLRDRGSGMTEQERQAIDRRIAHQRDAAPWAEFRYARLNGQWLRVLKLALINPDVRRKILARWRCQSSG
jgi:succinoglycan biosynthesis protein ExoO